MRIDQNVEAQVRLTFAGLQNDPARSFPPPGALSNALVAHMPAPGSGTSTVQVGPAVSRLFATASVDMWDRAVHSFLVSAALTNTSVIWSSVAGYYSSHYSVRALAHLLGYFQLHSKRQNVYLTFSDGQHVCEYHNKRGGDREHLAYWKIVKRRLFTNEALFTTNTVDGTTPADVAHRDRANYVDHLAAFVPFCPLDRDTVQSRINRISNIEFSAPPIPDVNQYPDIESVQAIAYHRLVCYRDLVDSILGGQNRFWRFHRNPPWATDFVDFQLVPQASMREPTNQ